MTDIIITPTNEKLPDEVQSLRNRIIQLLQERDHLMLVECPGIGRRPPRSIAPAVLAEALPAARSSRG